MENQYHNIPYSQSPSPLQNNNSYTDSRQLPPQLSQTHHSSQSSQPSIQYTYSNHTPTQSYAWSNSIGLPWSSGGQIIPPSPGQSMSMSVPNLVSSGGNNMVGMGGNPSPSSRPKLTTTLWEDEGTLCYQVDARSICVARRQDNDMINGTKLLNVVGMSRGKRDGILKNEKGRVVVKVGAMHLKGVWITFPRAKSLASQFKIHELLFPLFADDPSVYLYTSPGGNTNTSARLPGPGYGTLPSPYRTQPNLNSINSQWDTRGSAHQSSSANMTQRYPSATGISANSSLQGLLSHDQNSSHSPPNSGLRHSVVNTTHNEEDNMYLLNGLEYNRESEDVYVPQGSSAISAQNSLVRQRNTFPTPVSISPASSPSPSMMSAGAGQPGSYSPQQRPARVPSPRHHPYGAAPLQRSSSYTGSNSYNNNNIYGYGQQNMGAYGERPNSTERDPQIGSRPGAW